MRQGLTEEVAVELLNLRILMGITDVVLPIQSVQNVSALRHVGPVMMDGLPAAVDATARTCHDLHEIIGHFLVADRLHKLSRIHKAAGHGYLHGRSRHVEACLLPALETSDVLEGIRLGILLRHKVVSAAEGCLHYAAGGTKDHACAGTDSKR